VTPDPIEAAGGVVWRRDPGTGTFEICLVHRPRYDDWTLPKGKLNEGEGHVQAAEREVAEETGLRVRIGRALGEARYAKSDRGRVRPKVVRYWAMEAIGGEFTPSDEVDEIAWLVPADAARRLTFDHDRAVLARLVREG
jgi:8-oxo-dGTP diphosphatase